MKKILFIILFVILSTKLSAFEKGTNFNIDQFKIDQNSGKTVIVNSWNKFCTTCKAQTKVFESAMIEFKEVQFYFYEQTENPEIAEFLKIDYWTTIAVYKNNKEVAREIGLTKKDKIYELIKKGI
tara:strand:- start:658 stop:1032 length:375 start_codon:yes stop_codon:yes gene_type:complete